MSKIYKVGEAAKLLSVSRSTMQRWDREKRLIAQRNVTLLVKHPELNKAL